MTSSTMVGWVCAKCGRGGLTSVTVLNGLYLCSICFYEMQLAQPPITVVEGWALPTYGPGSHEWDLRELRAQRRRADSAEAALATSKTETQAMRALVERWALIHSALDGEEDQGDKDFGRKYVRCRECGRITFDDKPAQHRKGCEVGDALSREKGKNDNG